MLQKTSKQSLISIFFHIGRGDTPSHTHPRSKLPPSIMSFALAYSNSTHNFLDPPLPPYLAMPPSTNVIWINRGINVLICEIYMAIMCTCTVIHVSWIDNMCWINVFIILVNRDWALIFFVNREWALIFFVNREQYPLFMTLYVVCPQWKGLKYNQNRVFQIPYTFLSLCCVIWACIYYAYIIRFLISDGQMEEQVACTLDWWITNDSQTFKLKCCPKQGRYL